MIEEELMPIPSKGWAEIRDSNPKKRKNRERDEINVGFFTQVIARHDDGSFRLLAVCLHEMPDRYGDTVIVHPEFDFDGNQRALDLGYKIDLRFRDRPIIMKAVELRRVLGR
jgi:hypothetical protein